MNDPLKALLEAGALDISPFPPNSRYRGVTLALLEQPGQEPVAYLRRRFVPPPERFQTVQEHTVVEGDRIDNLAARYLADPALYWRLCDANGAMRPGELTENAGRRLRITLAEGMAGEDDGA